MNDRVRLVIATPLPRGQVSSIYAASVFQLQRGLRAVPDVELMIHFATATR
jgi:hypothetical protein